MLADFFGNFIYVESLLLCSISMADCDSVVFEGVEVNCDAVWSTDFVLAAVALAYVAVVVPHDIAKLFFERIVDFPGLTDQLRLILQQRRHSHSVWRQLWFQFQNDTAFSIYFF